MSSQVTILREQLVDYIYTLYGLNIFPPLKTIYFKIYFRCVMIRIQHMGNRFRKICSLIWYVENRNSDEFPRNEAYKTFNVSHTSRDRRVVLVHFNFP